MFHQVFNENDDPKQSKIIHIAILLYFLSTTVFHQVFKGNDDPKQSKIIHIAILFYFLSTTVFHQVLNENDDPKQLKISEPKKHLFNRGAIVKFITHVVYKTYINTQFT